MFALVRSDTHHIEKCPVITVVHSAFHHIFQKEITVSRITEFNISHKRPPFLDLTELGRHQLVKLGIAWELVYKRHKELPTLSNPCPAPTFVI